LLGVVIKIELESTGSSESKSGALEKEGLFIEYLLTFLRITSKSGGYISAFQNTKTIVEIVRVFSLIAGKSLRNTAEL
jgi:hypothetical protein